jgi:hypothetical protein
VHDVTAQSQQCGLENKMATMLSNMPSSFMISNLFIYGQKMIWETENK